MEGKINKNNNKNDGQPQQKINNITTVLITEKFNNIHLFNKENKNVRPVKRQRPLPYSDLFLKLNYNKIKNYNNNYSDNELNSVKIKLNNNNKKSRSVKRKRLFLFYNNST